MFWKTSSYIPIKIFLLKNLNQMLEFVYLFSVFSAYCKTASKGDIVVKLACFNLASKLT